MLRWRPSITLLALFLAACSTGPAAPVEIRVANQSARNFDRVLVAAGFEMQDHGAIPAGGASAYRAVERAYRYAYVEVHLGADRLVLQPIDFVGETPLRRGRYTYVLSLTPGDASLVLKLEPD